MSRSRTIASVWRTRRALLAVITVAFVAAACTRPGDSPESRQDAGMAVQTTAPTSASVPCDELGATWGGGLASLQPGGNYDVSGCETVRTPPPAEVVRPAERDSGRWGSARCNDGSPFDFMVQLSPSGTSQTWVIHLQGGGFCDDLAIPCEDRPRSLTSGLSRPDRSLGPFEGRGVLRRDSRINPAFYDANMVYAHYCTSDAWTGVSTERTPNSADAQGWFFSGRLNVQAMIEVLESRYGLEDADPRTRVLFSGSSAGGFGAQANADLVAALLPDAAAGGRLRVVNDGGIAPDFDHSDYRPGEADLPVRDVLSRAFEFWGSETDAHCIADQLAQGRPPGYCLVGGTLHPYLAESPPDGLGLPYLVQYSSVDTFGLDLHGIDFDDPQDAEALSLWRAAALASVEYVEWLFSGGGSPYHTLLHRNQGLSYGPPGNPFGDVLIRFWEGEPAERLIFGLPGSD